jgi:multidrug efflux pump subunit AcrB
VTLYVGLIVEAGFEVNRAPTGFIPEQDQGYLITVVQPPPGAGLAGTEPLVKRAIDIILKTHGIEHVSPFAGLDATTFTIASDSGTIFTGLPSLYNHALPGVTANTVLADLRQRRAVIGDAYVLTIPPPLVQGVGNSGGFKMMLEDRAGIGSEALVDAAKALVAAANKDPMFAGVYTLFNTGSPSIYADIDRLKAEKVGLTPTDVFSTLQVYLGSQYVNDFNLLGRTYQVIVTADGRVRRNRQDLTDLKARNATGDTVPIGTVTRLRDATIPYRVPRYNLFPAAEVQGVAASGIAAGSVPQRMEELAQQVLPPGIGFEWTEIAYQQGQKGTPTILVFGVAALFVFLVLAANYQSWKLPLSVVRADSADVPARVGRRAAVPWHANRHPGSNRLRGPGRSGCKERDPDRGVRMAEADQRRYPDGCRGPCRTDTAAAHSDDLPGVHPWRRPAGHRDQRGCRNASVARHCRVRGNVGCHRLQTDLHTGLLCHGAVDRRHTK